jgi:hypothetical protein
MNKWNLEKDKNKTLCDGLWIDPRAGTHIAEASSVPLDGPAQPAQPNQPAIQPADQAQPIQQSNPLDLIPATQVLPQVVQEIQSKVLTLWSQMGWSTHQTSDGDTILSYKALSREGKGLSALEFTVMTGECPYFQIKLGSEINQQDADTYLTLPKIYKINTDPGDQNTPVYTLRDKANYTCLLFTATKQRSQIQAGGKPRAGNTQCGVLWKDGTVSVMARAHFKKVTTEDEMKAIEKYCKSVDIPPPWKMDPKNINVPAESALAQQFLHAGRTGSIINSQSSAEITAAENSVMQGVATNLQTSMALLQAGVQAMYFKVEKSLTTMQDQLTKQQGLQIQMWQQLQQGEQQQMEIQTSLLRLVAIYSRSVS